MHLPEFLKALLRIAIAIFLAVFALIVVVAVCFLAKEYYDKRQAAPYETVRDWKVVHKDTLGLGVYVKTKVVSGKLLASIDVDGYPPYLSDPKNANGQLIFEFLDHDGFRIISKPLKISDFTTVVGKNEAKIGLRHQFEDYIDLESYKRFSQMQVGWNLDTKPAAGGSPQALPQKELLDHCATNLSKTERLRRLAQYGTVRETGNGSYSAAGRSVEFNPYDGTLLLCR